MNTIYAVRLGEVIHELGEATYHASVQGAVDAVLEYLHEPLRGMISRQNLTEVIEQLPVGKTDFAVFENDALIFVSHLKLLA